jgi:2-(1,2-epoxy-1,2-dihydrophenyl)acetyl-CoA isomerase
MNEIVTSRRGGVLTLRMNRPEQLNALDIHMARAVDQIAREAIEDTSVECVVITGTGRAFSAGGDMTGIQKGTEAGGSSLLDVAQRGFRALVESRLPVITAVNGIAAGAGFGIALLGDISIVSSAAKFRPAFIALGAVPDLGLAYSLPRLVGEVRARELLLTNRELSPAEALSWGMVTRVVEAKDFEAEVENAADALAAAPRTAMGLTKTLLRQGRTRPFGEYLELEEAAQNAAFRSPEIREGVAAFKEKRKADFRKARGA